MKTKKLEKEIFELKNKLLSGQSALIASIEEKFEKVLQNYKSDSDAKIEMFKKEVEKIVTNMDYDFKEIKTRIEKLNK